MHIGYVRSPNDSYVVYYTPGRVTRRTDTIMRWFNESRGGGAKVAEGYTRLAMIKIGTILLAMIITAAGRYGQAPSWLTIGALVLVVSLASVWYRRYQSMLFEWDDLVTAFNTQQRYVVLDAVLMTIEDDTLVTNHWFEQPKDIMRLMSYVPRCLLEHPATSGAVRMLLDQYMYNDDLGTGDGREHELDRICELLLDQHELYQYLTDTDASMSHHMFHEYPLLP